MGQSIPISLRWAASGNRSTESWPQGCSGMKRTMSPVRYILPPWKLFGTKPQLTMLQGRGQRRGENMGKADLQNFINFNHKGLKMPRHVHWWDLDAQRSLVPLRYHQYTVLPSSPNGGVPAVAPHLTMKKNVPPIMMGGQLNEWYINPAQWYTLTV